MTKARKMISMIMTFVILCGLFEMAFAVGDSDATNEPVQPATNAYEYAKAPEGVYVFRYYGENPNTDIDIDISECIVGRLYGYHAAADSVVEIAAQTVIDYTCTQTALYYVTEDQKIYKTDYNGTNHEYLYQCTQGAISILRSYFDALYFIEEQTRIMHLNVASKAAQEVWEYEYLDWVFMLNDTQLIATTTLEEDYLYDTSTNTATRISSIAATNMVTAAIKGTASNNARSANNPTGNYADIILTQENNVSFPLGEYWANPDGCYETTAPYRSEPFSWFHINHQEGCNNDTNCDRYCGSSECKGFAKYVHDVYAHMVDDIVVTDESLTTDEQNARADELWEDRTCMVTRAWMNDAADMDENPLKLWPRDTEDDVTKIKEFFKSLHTGAYVRYGKYRPVRSESGEILVDGDDTPWNGCHSIVFIACDEVGVWVYECNQSYVPNDPNDYYGCGVFIQYYPYERLFRYKYIRNYVNHNYTESEECYDAEYHKKGCTNCGAYVLQEHTAEPVLSYVNGTQHRASFACCSGSASNIPHTDVQAVYVNTSKHSAEFRCCDEGNIRTVAHNDVHKVFVNRTSHRTEYRCCDHDSAATAHTGTIVYTSISSSKHSVGYSCCEGSVTEVHMLESIGGGRQECSLCGYTNNNLLDVENEEVA